MKLSRGKFIVFEGIDGCGKSTQAKMLYHDLALHCIPSILTAEPSQGFIGSIIRDIQQGKHISNPDPITMMHLYTADRSEHLKWINQKLEEGTWVICDRYFFSSVAYQGRSKIEMQEILNVNSKFPCPDFTFWLYISPQDALERLERRGEPTEIFENEENLKRVSKNYEDLFFSYFESTNNYSRINATVSVDDIHQEIIKTLQNKNLL